MPDIKEETQKKVIKNIEDYRNSDIPKVKNSFMEYLYFIIVGSLHIDGCAITLQEARVLYDCGVTINGISGDECRYAESLRGAYMQMLDYVEKKSRFSVDVLQDVAHIMMSGCDSYEQGNKSWFINGYLHFSDYARNVYKENCCCSCYKEGDVSTSKLVDLCEVLNNEIDQIESDDFTRQYKLICWAHNMVLKHGMWGEFSGRMARLVMHWIQFIYNLPISHFEGDKDNYLAAVRECAQYNNCEALEKLVRLNLIGKTMRDLVRFGGYTTSKSIRVSKPAGRKRIELPVEDVYNMLCANNKLTARRIAMELGLGSQHVVRALNELKLSNRIEHVGSNKSGHWVILDR